MKKLICTFAAALTVFSCAGSVSADYLKLENSLKYIYTDSCEKKLYTGWTNTNGVKKYYSEGKRCVKWKKIDGSYYYLLPTGGYADGFFQIDGKIWEFNDGRLKYGPFDADEFIESFNGDEASIEGKPTCFQFETTFALTSQVCSDGTYLDDYCGMYWDSKKQKYVIMLTDLRRQDFYRGLGGESNDYEIVTGEFSRNYLEKLWWLCLDEYVSVICDSIISDKDNKLIISVTDESRIDEIDSFIKENGFDSMAYSIEFEPNPEKYYDE